jgi:CRISPR-associated endonuclease Cas1
MSERSLLIDGAFALRQQKGLPVWTEIRKEIIPHSKEFIEKYGKHFAKLGLKLADRKQITEINNPIDVSVLKRIIITQNGKGYLSTYFLDFCKVHQIPIYFVDGKGKIEASFIPFHYLKQSLALKQYEAIANGKSIDIAKYLIILKLESIKMENFIPNLRRANDIHAVVSVEAIATTKYHSNWSFPDEWNWQGRRPKNVRTRTNRNASNPISSMLNFGYGLLAQQMSEILLGKGFELSIGFMHQSEGHNKYWNQLSYDFIEPFRVWIDNCVKEMIAEKEIKPTDFIFSEDKSFMVFKDKALAIALDRFMKTLDPLEHKSLPIIRKVEKMLLGMHLDNL